MKSNQTRWLMVSGAVVLALGAALTWEYVHQQGTSGKGGGVASLSPDTSPRPAANAPYSPGPPAEEERSAAAAPPAAEEERSAAAAPPAAVEERSMAAAPPVASLRASCVDLVQGQIAWNYEGNKDWNHENVQNLCRGTSNPSEPPRCFDRVMHGGINWGGGSRWQWQNALDLCAGTNDAEATINCFQARIGQGIQWPNAIRDCK